ncbi:FAD-binding domain-containing protein [Imleria badia]|nr:FAD-binding domain-containing protein [Imleria badia]
MSQPKLDLALQDAIARIKSICAESKGASQYFPYGGSGYKASVTHYFESSTEVAGGAVQPGSEDDLARIVKAIADTHVEFAVKCGGHSTNPGFSSTKGIQIYLSRLNQITVDTANKLVCVGAGCLFEELYQELESYNLNIVGGSGLSGVGVAGWMVGGGYSVKTSQYGLGVDNVEAVRLVLPDGTIKVASATENKDLFFAVMGGCNNYGIISEFTLKAHAQGEFHYFDLVKEAIYKITQKQDNRANIEAAFRHYSVPGTAEPVVTLTVHCVYDGDYPSEDPFKELESIPQDDSGKHGDSLSGHHTGSFLLADLRRSCHNGTYDITSVAPAQPGLAIISDIPELEQDKPPMAGIGQFPRGRWGNVVVDEFTPGILDEIQAQAKEAAKELGQHGGTRITIGLWPFTKAMFDHATDSAFPHEKGKPNCPIIVYFTWEGEKSDQFWVDTMKTTLEKLRETVDKERPDSKGLPYFINTALAEATTVEDLYRNNLPRLKELRKTYDPSGVMDRTGGFRIPLA